MNSRWFNRGWVRLALTLVLIALILVWVGPASIWNTIKSIQPELLLLSLLFTPIVIGIKTLRWLSLARTQDPISFQEALRSYLAGLTLATLTPLSAGEAGRGLFVRTRDRAGLTGKVVLDKLLDLSTVGVFAGIGLVLTEEPAAQTIGVVILTSVIAAWGGALFLLSRMEALTTDMGGGFVARLRIPAIASGLASTPRPQLALNVALSMIGFTFFYGQAFVLMHAFWPETPWAVVPYFPIITLSTILPVAIGGVGIREWTAILLLRQFGVAESVAFNAFFVHFMVVQLLPALAGTVIISSFRGRAGDCPEKLRSFHTGRLDT